MPEVHMKLEVSFSTVEQTKINYGQNSFIPFAWQLDGNKGKVLFYLTDQLISLEFVWPSQTNLNLENTIANILKWQTVLWGGNKNALSRARADWWVGWQN